MNSDCKSFSHDFPRPHGGISSKEPPQVTSYCQGAPKSTATRHPINKDPTAANRFSDLRNSATIQPPLISSLCQLCAYQRPRPLQPNRPFHCTVHPRTELPAKSLPLGLQHHSCGSHAKMHRGRAHASVQEDSRKNGRTWLQAATTTAQKQGMKTPPSLPHQQESQLPARSDRLKLTKCSITRHPHVQNPFY